ncbi:hypothetical protein [Actinomadura nitritigenes]|uniref:Uncharacterized protein n=1 Tax=Actinomadura nitritigenes TaxID=134602 RepID=A0ABS3RCU4_9ACTN|nr:hypothetical protein [Actinomadura nitritigenes]MBO2444048.1 hypothetical protein [Actinomadura nitritigenes]
MGARDRSIIVAGYAHRGLIGSIGGPPGMATGAAIGGTLAGTGGGIWGGIEDLW